MNVEICLQELLSETYGNLLVTSDFRTFYNQERSRIYTYIFPSCEMFRHFIATFKLSARNYNRLIYIAADYQEIIDKGWFSNTYLNIYITNHDQQYSVSYLITSSSKDFSGLPSDRDIITAALIKRLHEYHQFHRIYHTVSNNK